MHLKIKFIHLRDRLWGGRGGLRARLQEGVAVHPHSSLMHLHFSFFFNFPNSFSFITVVCLFQFHTFLILFNFNFNFIKFFVYTCTLNDLKTKFIHLHYCLDSWRLRAFFVFIGEGVACRPHSPLVHVSFSFALFFLSFSKKFSNYFCGLVFPISHSKSLSILTPNFIYIFHLHMHPK